MLRKQINKLIYSSYRYYSKSSDIETLISTDNLKNVKQSTSTNTIDSIFKKYPTITEFDQFLKQTKPTGTQLYDFMILSRLSSSLKQTDKDYFDRFHNYIMSSSTTNLPINNNNNNYDYNDVTFEFILEFNSKSYRKIDQLFSILMKNNQKRQQLTSNQYSLFFDSILQIQFKIQDNTNIQQVDIVNSIIIELVEMYCKLLIIKSIQLNIGNYNKILEIYCNCNKRVDLVKSTLDTIYLSAIKPNMETYMIVFPYIPSEDSTILLSKIKNSTSFKSGPNAYQLLSSQFDKLIKDQEENNK